MIFAITGASGFLGVHIIHHLLSLGHTVRAICRESSSTKEFALISKMYNLDTEAKTRLSWFHADLYDIVGLTEAVSGSDYVMHLAGMISYRENDLSELLEVNKEYTANVAHVAKACDIKKLLYCSSIAAVSKNKDGITTEDIICSSEDFKNYGLSKYLGELEIVRMHEEGLSTVIINPGIILGFGNFGKGSNQLFGNAQRSFPFYSEGITGFVGVQDVATIAEKLCVSNVQNERFILVSENRSFKDIAYTMADSFGVRKPIIEIKGLLYKGAYAFVWIKELLGLKGMLSKHTVKASIALNKFDSTKVRSTLTFDFEPIEDVIRKAIKTHKKSLSQQ